MEPVKTTPDRSGAVWVTATGALLLFAAAVTFVAVRWDDLASWQKFAALVGVTQLLLAGGWLGRRRVPATAAATWSLGVVLIPLDAWTIAASGDGTWQRGLFAGGLLAVLVVPLARRWWDTVALRWAAILSVPLVTAGIAAYGDAAVPSALIVAAAGVAASLLGRRTAGRAWIGLASFATLAAAAERALPRGRGVLGEVGLVGSSWIAVAVGALVIAGAVVDGTRNRRAEWVWVLGVVGLADVLVGAVTHGAAFETTMVAGGVAFLAVELVGLSVVRDRFWAPIGAAVSVGAELLVGALLLTGFLGGTDDLAGHHVEGWTVVAALGFGVLGWVVADLRSAAVDGLVRPWRQVLTGPASIAPSIGVFACTWLIALTAPLEFAWCAGLLVAVGGLWLIANRAGAVVLGTSAVVVGALGIGAGWYAWSFVGLALLVVVLGVGAARRPTVPGAVFVTLAGTAALFVWALWWTFVADIDLDRGLWLQLDAVAVGLVVLGALATVRGRSVWASVPPWLVGALALGAAGEGLDGSGIAPMASIVTIAVVLGAWAAIAIRRELLFPGVLAAVASPWLGASVLYVAGLQDAALGIGVAVAAFVLVGVALVTPRIVRPFLLGAAGAHLAVGALVCLGDPGAFGLVLAMAGVLLGVVAGLEGFDVLAADGGLLVLLGTWQSLHGYGVTTPEAYLAPLALALAIGGRYGRLRWNVSSWWADAPAVAVLGGGALAVRIDGGPGWHVLLAGAVALVAVAVGGWRRLAGPLFGGSLLLAAVVVNETVRVTAGVPTWIWLALGGTALLGAGLSMEAHGLGPIESGRRLVDVIDERFD